MIIYSASKTEFSKDILSNNIEQILVEKTLLRLGQRTSPSEVRSWQNSLMYMNNALQDQDIPDDVMIAIEYKIPKTNRQIDFIVSGLNEKNESSIVIVELKQWEEAHKTEKNDLVSVRFGKGETDTPHPSYQAWSYAALLEDYNTAVQEQNIRVSPCAYLHNCKVPGDLNDDFYAEYIAKAPIFYRNDSEKLTSFIKKHVKYGDKEEILYKIENGKIRPSKSLSDELDSMLKGNQEFILIDDQKVVVESAVYLASKSNAKNKNVLIVEGGPGSGKSVVAINLLNRLTQLGQTVQYVSKNAAPRAVYERKLTKSYTKSRISNMFKGSGVFHSSDENSIDALIVDEAHRLNAKSGMFSNLGENQIKEIIHSSFFSVFFLDENQKVTFKDIGSNEQIKHWAKKSKATVTNLTLTSQFRCNGSDGYISWLDSVLQVQKAAVMDFNEFDYEIKVFDDPGKLHEEIIKKNKINNKSRIVAGYCWEWPSKKKPKAFDIEIDNLKVRWNLIAHGSAWIINPDSVTEAGCIHTCQGLELDYVGVIIGPDLIVRNGEVVTDGLKRAKTDQSIKGFKSKLKKSPDLAKAEVDIIIKNTYRTLMTRGMKGCYVYCTDKETRDYFRGLIK